MKRPDGLIICDYHKRGGKPDWHGEVLDDGVTIVPGYIVVTKQGVFELRSDDPNNEISQPGVLHNRHVDQNGNPLITKTSLKDFVVVDERGEDKHFCNEQCFSSYYNNK